MIDIHLVKRYYLYPFSMIDELREVDTYEERRKTITKYINEIMVLDFNKDTRQHLSLQSGVILEHLLIQFNHNHSYPVLPHNLQYKMDMGDRVGCWK